MNDTHLLHIYIPDQDVTETNNGNNDSISSEGDEFKCYKTFAKIVT